MPIIDDILARLNVAENVKAMGLPGYNLHPSKGKRRVERVLSIKVTGNWRVIFRFESGNVLDVNSIDYH